MTARRWYVRMSPSLNLVKEMYEYTAYYPYYYFTKHIRLLGRAI